MPRRLYAIDPKQRKLARQRAQAEKDAKHALITQRAQATAENNKKRKRHCHPDEPEPEPKKALIFATDKPNSLYHKFINAFEHIDTEPHDQVNAPQGSYTFRYANLPPKSYTWECADNITDPNLLATLNIIAEDILPPSRVGRCLDDVGLTDTKPLNHIIDKNFLTIEITIAIDNAQSAAINAINILNFDKNYQHIHDALWHT